jgi:hypothetical protein
MPARKRPARQPREEAERRQAWTAFHDRVESARGLAEAEAIVADLPPESHPGRKYYSNLGFFLTTFAPPKGGTMEEIQLYLRFLERMNAAGQLRQGVFDTLRNALKLALHDADPSRFGV